MAETSSCSRQATFVSPREHPSRTTGVSVKGKGEDPGGHDRPRVTDPQMLPIPPPPMQWRDPPLRYDPAGLGARGNLLDVVV